MPQMDAAQGSDQMANPKAGRILPKYGFLDGSSDFARLDSAEPAEARDSHISLSAAGLKPDSLAHFNKLLFINGLPATFSRISF
jgi:hypothetical protein